MIWLLFLFNILYITIDGHTECKCYVPEIYTEKFGVEAMLEDVYAGVEYDTIDEWNDAMKYYEDPGIAGEMFTSAG